MDSSPDTTREVPAPVRAALGVLPEAYGRMFDRLLAAVEGDERIRALWLSGSLARGHADRGSDLDTILAVRDEDLAEFAAQWRGWLEAINPVLIAREIGQGTGSFYSLNRDCLRLDVIVEPVGGIAGTPHRRRMVVLDRDGLDALVPEPGVDDPRSSSPDRERVRYLVEEVFRTTANFPPAVVDREDWLLGVAGVMGHRQFLYDVFVQANQPLPPMGVKQFSSKLTAAQRALLEDLPPVAAERASVIAGMRATMEAWQTAGREAVEACGVEWPSDLVDGVTAYFARALDG